MDMNDRVLRNIVVGLGRPVDGVVREDHFIISVASEIMATLSCRQYERFKRQAWQNDSCIQL